MVGFFSFYLLKLMVFYLFLQRMAILLILFQPVSSIYSFHPVFSLTASVGSSSTFTGRQYCSLHLFKVSSFSSLLRKWQQQHLTKTSGQLLLTQCFYCSLGFCNQKCHFVETSRGQNHQKLSNTLCNTPVMPRLPVTNVSSSYSGALSFQENPT